MEMILGNHWRICAEMYSLKHSSRNMKLFWMKTNEKHNTGCSHVLTEMYPIVSSIFKFVFNFTGSYLP